MENSAPLLSPSSDSVEQETVNLNKISTPSSIDAFIEWRLEAFSFTQFIQAIILSVAMFIDAQQTFITVFTDAEPTCNGDSSSDFCFKTIISEWGLESANSVIVGFPSSSFFVGSLLGGFILPTLGDSILGRKNLLFFSCLATSIAALLTIFSTNIWVYTVFRFLTGFTRSPVSTSALVLLVEMIGKKWRGLMVVIIFLVFSLGILSLPPIAYVQRFSSWKSLYLWTSIPSIFYCVVVHFMLNESPRWLFLHGHEAEAMEVLSKLSSSSSSENQNNSNIKPLNLIIPNDEEDDDNYDIYSSMRMLFKSRWASTKLLWSMALAFGIGMVYYGLLLGAGNLSFNLYLSVTLNGLMDIPAYFMTFILIEKWNRKSSMLGFCLLSGLCSLISVSVNGQKHGNLEIGLELMSLFCVCVAFNVVLIYTTELFPTIVRSSASAMVRQALNFGAVFSPVLISYGRKCKFLSYGVFGLVVIFCGLFVICLPETRGTAICDTLEEQEKKDCIIA